ncbi:MAG: Rab family GTPase [Ardenticatenaceae bacterium]|nr:Rab family GTPase [Ardenticatenaceae bacterium]
MKTVQRKICLLGDFSVGKTSLVRQFVEGRFDDRYLSTIGVKISRRQISRPDYLLNLLIWDLAGGDDYDDVTSGYLRGAAGILMVCDLTRPLTLHTLRKYRKQLDEIKLDPVVVIAANKVDLVAERAVDDSLLEELSQQINAPYLLSSAKTGEGVAAAFDQIAGLLEKKKS